MSIAEQAAVFLDGTAGAWALGESFKNYVRQYLELQVDDKPWTAEQRATIRRSFAAYMRQLADELEGDA